MADRLVEIGNGFWNIRGAFRIGGVINIGTHASLVRLQSGGFVLLDAYTLQGRVKKQVMDLTHGGTAVAAIINLHPFHTVHCAQMHKDFPQAKLYGADRHVHKFPDLPWEDLRVDDPAFAVLFAADFEFTIPAGVDFTSANENVHFSSVLAYHLPSKTIHVDDTLMYVPLPTPLKLMGAPNRLGFHPTLGQALQKRGGAVDDFRAWANKLATDWGDAHMVCTAHMGNYTAQKENAVRTQIKGALSRVERTLKAHEKKYG